LEPEPNKTKRLRIAKKSNWTVTARRKDSNNKNCPKMVLKRKLTRTKCLPP
jgi:hypothetical protein